MIEMAIRSNSDLIVFPELSITGYEPKLAKKLAADLNDPRFDVFQELADINELVIAVGAPIKADNGITISMLIFRPDQKRSIYSKQILHEDEFPYFVSGTDQPFLEVKGLKIGMGICYETLQPEHIVNAVENGADIYIASVSKPERGVDKAYLHFPAVAEEFGISILMANSVGYCDKFMSHGHSSAWDISGNLCGQLDEKDQGVLIYDTTFEKSETYRS